MRGRGRKVSILFPFFFFFILSFSFSFAWNEEYVVIDTAERFFKALQEGQYSTVWSLLTPKSKNIIIKRVYKGLKEEGFEVTKEEVEKDFEEEGDLFLSYWEGFRREFNPSLVLEKAQWELKEMKKGRRAIILLKYKGTVPLKLYFRNGRWLVGFEESF